MFYLIEILILSYLGFLSWQILKKKFASHLLTAGAILVGILGSTLVFTGLGRILPELVDNFVVVLLIDVMLGVGAYVLIVHLLKRRIRRNDEALVKRWEQKLALPRWLDRALCGVLLALVWGLAFVVVEFLVSLVSLTPTGATIAERTMALRFLIPSSPQPQTGPAKAELPQGWDTHPDSDPVERPADAEKSLEALTDEQSRFLSSLRTVFDASRDYLAEKTGSREVRRRIEALQAIVNLSDAEKHWLVETTPSLKRLLTHPSLVAIMENEEVLRLVEQVAQGSIPAIYKLGGDAAIKKLLNDQDVAQVIADVDLLELERRIQARREQMKRVIRTTWLVTSIRATTELDRKLKNRRLWWRHPSEEGSLMWPPQTRFGLAWSLIKSKRRAKVELRCRTEGSLTVWANGRNLDVAEVKGTKRASVPLTIGDTELLLMIDFRSQDSPKACLVEALLPP